LTLSARLDTLLIHLGDNMSRFAAVFHYAGLALATRIDQDPTCDLWLIHSQEQLKHLLVTEGVFQEFGPRQLPDQSTTPHVHYREPAMLWFLQALAKLWAVRSYIPNNPSHRNLRRDVLWLEGEHKTTERVRLLMVCAHTAELRFVAIVYSRLQLRELLDKFYSRQRAQDIYSYVPTSPLPQSSNLSMLIINDRQLASDIVQGMIMRGSLILPPGA